MRLAFWQGKKVFITGHTGFKGSWLSLWLSETGAKVYGYSLPPPTQPSLFEVANVQDSLVNHEIGNVCDLAALQQSLQASEAEIVFHLAAQSLVRESYVNPLETYTTNVMGTANLLEACRKQPTVRVVVVVTSDKCYENREWIWPYREIDPMGGHDPYSSSKGCAELVTAAYARSFFDIKASTCSAVSVRAGNVIGGGDWAKDRLMADIMIGLFKGKPIIIRKPDAIRPWQHVLDPISGYMAAAEKLRESDGQAWEAWNFGPRAGDEKTVGEVAKMTCELWGRSDLLIIGNGAGQPHEATLLKLDCTKANERLGWRPRLGFRESISWTVEWFQKFIGGGNMRQITLTQIAEYARLI